MDSSIKAAPATIRQQPVSPVPSKFEDEGDHTPRPLNNEEIPRPKVRFNSPSVFLGPFGLDLLASGRRDSSSVCSLVNSCHCVSLVRMLQPLSLSSVGWPYQPPRPPSCECDGQFPLCYLTASAPGTFLCSSSTNTPYTIYKCE